MTGEMMDPALFSKLDHDGIDERVSGFAVFPGLKIFVIFLPFYLLADGVSFDFVEIWCECSTKIKEFSP